ncbi:MAG: hypothetical protein ABI383_09660 [Acidobacteriaceae bacterium]
MKITASILLLLLLTTFAAAQVGQTRRDPMTDKEVDQMREYRDQADKRVHLMVTIIQKRMDELAKLEKTPTAVKPAERGGATHDLLEDITNLIDEFDDNIDTFLNEQDDIRKQLNEAVTMETALLAHLNAIKTSDAGKPWFSDYSFQLNDAIEAVTGSLQSNKDAIAQDEKIVKAKKEKEKEQEKARQPR